MENDFWTPWGDLAHDMAEARAKAKVREIVREELRAAGALKPKRFVLPMPSGDPDESSTHVHVAIKAFGKWRESGAAVSVIDPGEHSENFQYTFTQADIDAAPSWVKAITPVEVRDAD